ncbi:hypothetical protein ACFQ5M_11265 [Agrilactobacillus yilanensis]|uniref:Holin-like toxin n=1 Tax=Agrilactobacillus yilanensis TaxID=2485997 RepID=A0ABW4JAN4_9LACO|nr:hypothetical protein [Agrilactobacillus yilanensis]
MAKHEKKTPEDELKVRTARYVALGAWAILVTQLIDLIKFIIKRLT